MKPLRRSLADLPEELIELILQSITCQSSLAAAALTSRQLHRIAQPILIESVSIVVSADGELSGHHDNRRRFRKALMEQPDLASSVKTLKLFQFDPDDPAAEDSRHNGCLYLQDLANIIAPLLNSLPNLEVLDVSECLEHDIIPGSILGVIDLWAHQVCEHYTPNFFCLRTPAPPPACFTCLKVLHVSMLRCVEYLNPLFRLPNLEHLGLHDLTTSNGAIFRKSNWPTTQDCPIKVLSLTNLHLEGWHDEDSNYLLYAMATVLKHLQTLNITALSRGHAFVALLAFKQCIPQLSTLEVHQNMEHPPEPPKKVLEDDDDLDDQDDDEQNLANLLADERRNDWLFPALASAPALKVLHLDVTELHTPASLAYVPDLLDWSTSMPNLTNYYDSEVYPYASNGDFEDCWNRVQIPLSPAVEELYLHLRATDMRRFGIGLLYALTQLGLDLPTCAPRLRQVGMVIKENNSGQDTGVVWREMAGLFRGKGVVLWQVGP